MLVGRRRMERRGRVRRLESGGRHGRAGLRECDGGSRRSTRPRAGCFMSSRCLSLLPACATACFGRRRSASCASAPTPTTCRSRTSARRASRIGWRELVARELGARVEYTWWPEREAIVQEFAERRAVRRRHGRARRRSTPSRSRGLITARLMSSSRADIPASQSLDDPRLRKMRIGVQMVGDDYAPPAYALARQRPVGESWSAVQQHGDEPAARLSRRCRTGDVDVAVMWGPFAGYFAPQGSRDHAGIARHVPGRFRSRTRCRWRCARRTPR